MLIKLKFPCLNSGSSKKLLDNLHDVWKWRLGLRFKFYIVTQPDHLAHSKSAPWSSAKNQRMSACQLVKYAQAGGCCKSSFGIVFCLTLVVCTVAGLKAQRIHQIDLRWLSDDGRAHHRGSNPLDPSLLVLRCCNQGRRLQWTCAQQKGQKEGCETVDWEMEAVHKEISRTWDHCCPSNANICPPSNQLLHVETEAVSLLSFSTHKPLCMPLNPIAEKYFIGSVFGSLFFTISMNWQKCTPNFSPPTSQWSVQLQFCSCHFKMSTLHAT